MRTVLRWVGRIALGLVALVLVGLGVLYVLSARVLGDSFDPPRHSITLPDDPGSIAEGRRLAQLRGCYDGCHGDGYSGDEAFVDEGPLMGILLARMTAPDLTRIASAYTEEELERVIRHGVRPNGDNVVAMPSDMFQGLSDQDLGKILASIRATPESSGPETLVRVGPMARFFLLRGVFELPATAIDHDATHLAATPTEPMALGRYLAYSMCTECHGRQLEGVENQFIGSSPPLAVVAGYTRERFGTLMRTGVPASGAELGLMADVARSRFNHLTEEELDALHAYLADPASWAGLGESSR